jgi:hypothetical protein
MVVSKHPSFGFAAQTKIGLKRLVHVLHIEAEPA